MEKRNYRALLIDVDGTLLCAQRKTLDKKTAAALTRLQSRGVIVALATGRGKIAVRSEVMGNFLPDYAVCLNGAYVITADGRVLYDHPMSRQQFEDILRVADEEGCPIGFSFEECYYMYLKDEVYRPFYRRVNGDMVALRDGTTRTRHLHGMPYAAFGMVPSDKVSLFEDESLNLHITVFNEDVCDICQRGITKATGAARLLEAVGLGWDELVAVGDGENDIELLEAAGLGIAMGNAPDHVKIHADAVTGTVLEDGVLRVIQDYF